MSHTDPNHTSSLHFWWTSFISSSLGKIWILEVPPTTPWHLLLLSYPSVIHKPRLPLLAIQFLKVYFWAHKVLFLFGFGRGGGREVRYFSFCSWSFFGVIDGWVGYLRININFFHQFLQFLDFIFFVGLQSGGEEHLFLGGRCSKQGGGGGFEHLWQAGEG